MKVLPSTYDNQYFMITGKQSTKIIDLLNLIKEILNLDINFVFDDLKNITMSLLHSNIQKK